MGLFKRVAELERQNIAIAKKLAEIESKLPDYEEAVARGVDGVWNKAVQSIIDYNPFAKPDDGAR